MRNQLKDALNNKEYAKLESLGAEVERVAQEVDMDNFENAKDLNAKLKSLKTLVKI